MAPFSIRNSGASNKPSALQPDGRWFILLGTCLDLLNATSDKISILKTAAKLEGSSEGSFLDWMDFLSGRFVLIHGDDERAVAYGDATVSRACFYGKKESEAALGSHARLVSDWLGLTEPSPSAELVRRHHNVYTMATYPVDSTPWNGVMQFTPNVRLVLPTMELERFYPRAPIKVDPDVAACLIDIRRVLDIQSRLLSADPRPLVMGLTAGRDSRFALANMQRLAGDIQFFTYHLGDRHSADRDAVPEIVRRLGINHETIEFVPTPPSDQGGDPRLSAFLARVRRWTHHQFSHELAFELQKYFSRDSILLTGFNAAIIKHHYGKFAWRWTCLPPMRVEWLVKAWGAENGAEEFEPVFADWVERSDFSRWDEVDGYDSFDGAYWENRAGTWGGLVPLEQDLTFDSLSAFNCRYILDRALRLPRRVRRDRVLFEQASDILLPELQGLDYK